MKRFCQNHRGRLVLILMTFFLVTGLPAAKTGWSVDASDFELKLYPANGQYKYQLDEPIKLIMVLRNAQLPALYTKQGFELHQALIVTDPAPPGTVYNLQKAAKEHDMLRPFPWKGVTGWKEAQAFELPLSETINVLQELHPLMLRIAGWHTIKARLKLYLFDRAEEHPVRGLLGLANTGDNWLTIETKQEDEIQIYISPDLGAQLQARVLEGESQPLAQVPVSVFKNSGIPAEYELAEIWQTIKPVLAGATNFEGQAVWTSGGQCQSNSDYLVIAYYKGEYRDASIAADDGDWGIECSGSITRTIVFGGDEPPPIPGDLDGDGDVDIDDIAAIRSYLNQSADVCPECDIDEDGIISVGDLRKLVLLCTRPRCANK